MTPGASKTKCRKISDEQAHDRSKMREKPGSDNVLAFPIQWYAWSPMRRTRSVAAMVNMTKELPLHRGDAIGDSWHILQFTLQTHGDARPVTFPVMRDLAFDDFFLGFSGCGISLTELWEQFHRSGLQERVPAHKPASKGYSVSVAGSRRSRLATSIPSTKKDEYHIQ